MPPRHATLPALSVRARLGQLTGDIEKDRLAIEKMMEDHDIDDDDEEGGGGRGGRNKGGPRTKNEMRAEDLPLPAPPQLNDGDRVRTYARAAGRPCVAWRRVACERASRTVARKDDCLVVARLFARS